MMMQEKYFIDYDKISKTFAFKDPQANENTLNHRANKEMRILPYQANKSKIVIDLKGVVGALIRSISGKTLKEFNKDDFIKAVVDCVAEFEDEALEAGFINIIKTTFINDEGNLVNFDISTMQYINSTSEDETYAEFLSDVLFDDELKNRMKDYFTPHSNNAMTSLVLKALANLESDESRKTKNTYHSLLPFVREQFKNDIVFLMSNPDMFCSCFERVLEFYNVFYVSQLAMKLTELEKADYSQPTPIYYCMSWEKLSKNRRAYKYGYEKLKKSVDSLYSYSILLEMINNSKLNEKIGFNELYNIMAEDDDVEKQFEKLIDEYKSRIVDTNWEDFKFERKELDVEGYNRIYELVECIEYQFVNKNSSRRGAYDAYAKRCKSFIENNFGKRRGILGYTLALNEDDVVLLTKLIINNNEKIKLSRVFEEFQNRGIFLDKDSKTKVIQLYEKLNLLEKKSDSGDAQYVKSSL